MKFKRFFLFTLIATLAILLTACGSAPASSWPGMVASADGANVYLASSSYVYNVQVKDGTEVTISTPDSTTPVPARFPIKSDGAKAFYAPPAISSDGQVLVGSAATSDHTFYSYDPLTTNTKWMIPTNSSPWLAGALVVKDAVYAPGGDGNLYAYSLAGVQRWVSPISKHSLWSTPVADSAGKQIYLVTIDHQVIAINPLDGKPIWSVTLDNSIIGSPAVAGNMLVVGTLSGKLYALDQATGSQKWVNPLVGEIWGTPGYDGSNVYIGTVVDKTGKFYAVNASNGQTVWSKDDEGSITAGPLVTNDQIIYGTELGKIQSVDKTGTPKWQATIENAHMYTPPLLAGNMVIVAPMNATFLLAAYDLNGAQKWTFIAK